MTMKTIEIYKELELQKEENCPIECKKLKRTCPNGLRHKPSNKLQEICTCDDLNAFEVRQNRMVYAIA